MNFLTKEQINEKELNERLIDNIQKNGKEDLELIIKAVILVAGKNQQELNKIIEEQKEILNGIPEENEENHKQYCLVRLLEIGHGNNGYYKLNQVIETVIKKVEFVDKFNFDTV